jgi:fructoselysine-6-P-deglycase FrlB-like protein
MAEEMSIVEETLRSQREAWREISERVSSISSREFPMEPPKRILLFGLGSSHFAARLAGFSLIRDRSRPRVPVVACSSMSLGNEVIPGKGDWAFGFSHRGSSKPTTRAMDLCERSGAFTILVCGKDVQPMESAKYVLHTSQLEQVEPHTVAVTGAICAVTTLLMGSKAVEEWDALRSIGDPDLELLRRRAGEGPDLLLGEWEGEWMAREGALKLMEMARLPVRVFGSEEFFHGPRFSHSPEKKTWHVSLPGDDRTPEIKAVHTISVFGATPMAWIPALVELQWLSLAVALNRGVNPDDPNSA